MSLRIALAEDNSFLVKTLLEKLSFFDKIIIKHTSENGVELLENLEKDSNVDVILMDIQMPEMDGIKATEMVKKKYPQIKVMMLTIFDDDENIFNAIKAGADAYILKEADPKSLYDNIIELMEGGAPMTPSIALRTLHLLRNPEKLEQVEKSEEVYNLSERQIEILEQLSKSLNYNDIANNLFISPKTVRKHIENIYRKLQVHSKLEAVQKAKKHRLI
jgi:DNA-binding NarL/FixJ family response regulator